MTVLVTGASGFLGRHLVRSLRDEGREVVTSSGDLRDPSSYTRLLAPGISVFHLAAIRNHPRVRTRDMEEVNVRATAELARRSLEAGVGRFVHVSTALAHGPRFGAYMESKARAAEEVLTLAAGGLPAVVVSPSIVYGPDHPSHPNRITSEIRRLLRQRLVLVVDGGRQKRNLVHVDDVVRGLLAAERNGRVGEDYILGGEEIAPRDFGRLVLSLAGLEPVATLSLPAGPALAAAKVADRWLKSENGSGYTTAARVLLQEWCFSSGRAMQDLAYRPRPLAEGLSHTIEWLKGAAWTS